jgi:fructokinase
MTHEPTMRIGVDLGGTKIEAVGLCGDGSELGRMRVPTPAGDYGRIVEAIGELVEKAEDLWGRAATVGVGTPGAIDPGTGLLKNSNSVALNGKPLRRDIESVLAREIRMANDADCFVLSEATDGAAAGAAVVFGVILGTGVGGGLIVDGRLLSGPNAITGEWGHNPLPWMSEADTPTAACYCGLHGCIETFLSGSGLRRDHAARTGEDLDPEAVVAGAGRGGTRATATMDVYLDRLARALASVINIVDPEVIVVGGGLSNVDAIYTEIPARWGEYVLSSRVLTSIVPAGHGDSSGVRGAARLGAAPPA